MVLMEEAVKSPSGVTLTFVSPSQNSFWSTSGRWTVSTWWYSCAYSQGHHVLVVSWVSEWLLWGSPWVQRLVSWAASQPETDMIQYRINGWKHLTFVDKIPCNPQLWTYFWWNPWWKQALDDLIEKNLGLLVHVLILISTCTDKCTHIYVHIPSLTCSLDRGGAHKLLGHVNFWRIAVKAFFIQRKYQGCI